jgi:site-specific recombinase XerD
MCGRRCNAARNTCRLRRLRRPSDWDAISLNEQRAVLRLARHHHLDDDQSCSLLQHHLFAVFAGAGVRSSEAITMQVGSVEAAERSPRLRVLGKGNKVRVIPVGPEVVAAVDRYLVGGQGAAPAADHR